MVNARMSLVNVPALYSLFADFLSLSLILSLLVFFSLSPHCRISRILYVRRPRRHPLCFFRFLLPNNTQFYRFAEIRTGLNTSAIVNRATRWVASFATTRFTSSASTRSVPLSNDRERIYFVMQGGWSQYENFMNIESLVISFARE